MSVLISKESSKIARYWGRKVGSYVAHIFDNYIGSLKGKIVCDPFGGAGSIILEALAREAKVIYIDINPYAHLIVRVLLEGANLNEVDRICEKILSRKRLAYRKANGKLGFIEKDKLYTIKIRRKTYRVKYYIWEDGKCYAKLENGKIIPECKDLENVEPYYWYPKNLPLKYPNGLSFDKKRNYEFIADFFTKRNLIILSNIYHDIMKYTKRNSRERRALLLAFLSILYQASKMAREKAGSWGINSYWVPKRHIEKNPYVLFISKVKKIRRILELVKKNIKELSLLDVISTTKWINGDYQAILINNDAITVMKKMPSESIDFIITDPPHTDEIQYLELSFFTNSWLIGQKCYELFPKEIIVNNRQGKDFRKYIDMLEEFFKQCFRILKDQGKIILFYHEERERILNKMINLIEDAGFIINSKLTFNSMYQRNIGDRDTLRGRKITIVIGHKHL